VICPYCSANDDKVIDSRASDGGKVIRRRRECLGCGRRFTTYERVEELGRLTVVKRDGTRAPFSRENILRGIDAACGKRPIARATREGLVDEVEESLYRDFEKEVPSREIGERVCQRLKDLDEVAYIRFASEYHRFKDLGEIAQEISELRERVRDVKDQQRLFDPAPKGPGAAGTGGGGGRGGAGGGGA
jgi:transcriptional repressor NrdR